MAWPTQSIHSLCLQGIQSLIRFKLRCQRGWYALVGTMIDPPIVPSNCLTNEVYFRTADAVKFTKLSCPVLTLAFDKGG